MASSTIARLVAVHFWPVEKNAALTTFSTAELKSAVGQHDGRILAAHLELNAQAALGGFGVQPVADLAGAGERDGFQRLGVHQRLAQFAARAGTKLTTPFGMPASCSASTMRQALSGAADAGFTTMVLPQISAGAIFHAGMALGKFQGVTRPTTPIGFADGEHVDAVALGRNQHARQARAFAGEIAQDIDRAAHFAFGFGKRLAFFARHLRAELIELAIEDVGGFE